MNDGMSNPVEEIVRLSPQASGLLFHALKDGNDAYHIGVAFEIRSDADRTRIDAVWQGVQRAQPALRSTLAWHGLRTPHQVIHTRPRIPLEYMVTDDAVASRDAAQEWLATRRQDALQLDREVFRIACFHHAGGGGLTLAFSFHHVLMDGWSSALLVSLWVRGLRGETAMHVPARAYAQQLARTMEEPARRRSGEFWRSRFERLSDEAGIGGTRLLDQPIFADASDATAAGGAHANLRWNGEKKARVEAVCARAGVTPACFLYLCWALILAKLTYQRTVVMGCTFSGRGAAGPEAADAPPLGLFTNTIPLILELDGQASTIEALQSVFEALQRIREHENTPSLTIRAAAGISEDLYDTIVVFDNYPIDPSLQDTHDRHFLTAVHSQETTHFGLTLSVSGVEEWQISLRTNERYAGPSDAPRRVLAAFDAMAVALIEAPESRSVGAPVLRLDADGPAGGSLIHGERTSIPAIGLQLTRMWERLVRHPEEAFLTEGQAPVRNRDLVRGIVAVQDALDLAGFVPGDRVAVFHPKGAAAVQAILAILFSGGSYCYLNPAEPPRRRRLLLNLSDCRLLIGDSRAPDADLGDDVACLSVHADGSADGRVPMLRSNRPPDDEFYFIFTSGTTGIPKGIPVRGESVANQLAWFIDETRLGPSDTVLGLTELNFDPSVQDLFATLLAGGTLVYPESRVLRERQAFAQALQAGRVTLVNFVPGAIAELLRDAPRFPEMRLWIFGGESLPAGLRDTLLAAGYSVRNHYGPSETTVDCLSAIQVPGPIAIGRPIRNVSAFAADIFGQVLPDAVRGELWVAGVAVASGYWQRPEETARAFVVRDDGRWYRTGDLVTHSGEGGFGYHGRIDDQLKINGIRIEPRELESAAETLPGIRASALLHLHQPGTSDWVMCIDGAGPAATLEAEVRTALRQLFPSSWVQPRVVALDGFPRTATGKIDRRDLHERVADLLRTQDRSSVTIGDDPLQARLLEIWEDVLGRKGIGPGVNFFDAGGDSLKTIHLQSRLQEAFGGEIGVAHLFEHTTIAAFAEWIRQRDGQSAKQSNTRNDTTPVLAGRSRLAGRRNKALEVRKHDT